MTMRSALYALFVSANLAAAGASSPEALVNQVLAGLEAKDEKSLHDLVITEAEFKKYIWPNVQGGFASTGQVRPDQYFATYMKASDAGLSERLRALGGQKWELVKVSFGHERRGKGYRLLSHAEALLRNASGEQKTFPIAGTILDQGETYKIGTYWVRETRSAK